MPEAIVLLTFKKERGTCRMAEKDIAEKILEDYPDVFADIVNGLLFNGETIIRPEELEDSKVQSAYRSEGNLHELERDVAKRWKKNDIRIACVGFENQTSPDHRMVLRVYGYDGAEYRAQCLKENAGNPPYPVLTLVLYFGYKQRWNQPRSLFEAMDVPDEFRPFITDMKINVFEIAWLTDEQISRFKSDFRIVADYFAQKRKTGMYTGTKDEIRHVQALLQLLFVMEKDDRFEQAYVEEKRKGGIRNMCDVIDHYLKIGEEKGVLIGFEKGRIEGRSEGRSEGELLGEAKTICALYASGMSPEEIASRLKKDVEEVKVAIQKYSLT